MRQQSPGATALGDREDGIDDAAAFMFERTPHGAMAGNQRRDDFPLGVGEVGRVSVFLRHSCSYTTFYDFPNTL